MNYTDAPPGFQPVTEFSDAPPGFKLVTPNPYNDEGASWSEQPSGGKSVGGFLDNAGRDVRDVASETYNAVTSNPRAAAGGMADYLLNPVTYLKSVGESVGNLWNGGIDRAYEHPVKTGLDVANVLPPVPVGAALKGVSIAEKAIPRSATMPRAVVRGEEELIGTGGGRLKKAKLNPSKVDAADIQAPMQRFRERLDENALSIDAYTNPRLQNVIKRLDAAYAPPKAQPEARMTRVAPATKPPVTLKELHAHKQQLQRVIDDTKGPSGQITTDGVIAIEAKKAVDEMISAHPESTEFKIGSSEVHRGKMSETLSELKSRASQRTQWKNGDEAGALSAEIGQFLRARKHRHAVPKEVRKKLDRLSRDSKGKLLGAFSTNSSFGGNVFARGIEMGMGLPPGTAALVGGNSARAARNARFMQEFERIQEELRAGGPIGK